MSHNYLCIKPSHAHVRMTCSPVIYKFLAQIRKLRTQVSMIRCQIGQHFCRNLLERAPFSPYKLVLGEGLKE